VTAGDRATVSVLVKVSQVTAFDVFTREIDLGGAKGPDSGLGVSRVR